MIIQRVKRDIQNSAAFTKMYLDNLMPHAPNLPHKLVRLYPQFSFSAMLEGLGNILKVKYDGNSKLTTKNSFVEWELEGEYSRLTRFAAGSATGNVGANNQTFPVCLEENLFYENDTAKLENDQEIVFHTNAQQTGASVFRYTASLVTNNPNEVVDATALFEVGRSISALRNIQGELSDRGYIREKQASEKHREYLTTIRRSYSMSGHAASTMYMVKDGKAGFFMSEADRILLENFMFDKEMSLLKGKSTVTPDGKVLKTINGKPIIAGNGLENQLASSSRQTYTRLSKKLLQDIMVECERRSGRTEGINMLLITGTEGYREFQEVMEGFLKIGDNIYATRSGNNITMGGNFTKYLYGNSSITVTRNHILDYRGEAQEIVNGKGLNSSKMYFIDTTVYDGEPNIQVVTREGRAMVINEIEGVGGRDGKTSGKVSSPIDGSSKHVIGECGLKVTNPYSSMILEKVV